MIEKLNMKKNKEKESEMNEETEIFIINMITRIIEK
jgi:hypothetical protein